MAMQVSEAEPLRSHSGREEGHEKSGGEPCPQMWGFCWGEPLC